MQDEYPADAGVRLRRVCDAGEAASVSGRLFLCRRCRTQVVVCSCCDRGQIYCPDGCAGQARRETLQRAGARYRRSGRGRQVHAAQMARRRAEQREKVTHHGSPAVAAGDLVPGGTATVPCDDASPAEPLRRVTTHCHWCGRACLPWLRQEFLRRRDHRRCRADHVRTEHNAPW
jgi:hypothetical protein